MNCPRRAWLPVGWYRRATIVVGTSLLAQAEASNVDWQSILTKPFTVAIVVFGIVYIVITLAKHRERMSMIEHGLHPDAPSPDADDAAGIEETA